MTPDTQLASAPDKPHRLLRIINRILRLFGCRISSSKRRIHLGEAAVHLAARGIAPKTLIDVGVAWGTDDLYDAFPSATLLLVEPNPQWKSTIAAILKKRAGSAAFIAAGNAKATVTLYVGKGEEGSSSVMRSNVPRHAEVSAIEVPVQRLDALCAERGCRPPFVVKIDVQGAEAGVIEGMTGILNQTEAIIVEISLFSGESGPEIAEIIQLMLRHGWKLYDIVGFNYRPRDGALGQVDAVFVPQVGAARDSHEWT